MARIKQLGASFSDVKRRIKALPIRVAVSVAAKAAPALTAAAQSAFRSRRTVYGDPRPASVKGSPLDLTVTGTAQRTLGFTARGTLVRAVLSAKYVRYLIGKYGILPNSRATPPASWRDELSRIAEASLVAEAQRGLP